MRLQLNIKTAVDFVHIYEPSHETRGAQREEQRSEEQQQQVKHFEQPFKLLPNATSQRRKYRRRRTDWFLWPGGSMLLLQHCFSEPTTPKACHFLLFSLAAPEATKTSKLLFNPLFIARSIYLHDGTSKKNAQWWTRSSEAKRSGCRSERHQWNRHVITTSSLLLSSLLTCYYI